MLTDFRLGLGAVLALLCGCSPYAVHDLSRPAVETPEAFLAAGLEPRAVAPLKWWEAFADTWLNEFEETALRENLSLRQSWHRLAQVAAQARAAGAPLMPQVDLDGGASFARTVDRQAESPRRDDEHSERYFVGAGLSYELDVWRRIASEWDAATLRYEATREDVEATALVLSGTVASLWFTILEQEALSEVVAQQVAVGERFLELTELRFSLGQGSELDVYQQRQQVAATRSALPLILTTLETSRNQLAVLVGRPPGALDADSSAVTLPQLPPFPALPAPEELFETRPDLRAEMLRLRAADFDVAAAVADRMPRLAISLSYEFSATRTASLFKQELGSVIGNLVTPLIDGGRRRAEVARRQAVVQELLDGFAQAYLDALLDVENSLIEERRQLELLERLGEEFELAQSTLNESRSRYANGLNDYLSVLVALQSVQNLERRLVSETQRLLVVRSDLYRALGGKSWTAELEPPPPRELTARESTEPEPTAEETEAAMETEA